MDYSIYYDIYADSDDDIDDQLNYDEDLIPFNEKARILDKILTDNLKEKRRIKHRQIFIRTRMREIIKRNRKLVRLRK